MAKAKQAAELLYVLVSHLNIVYRQIWRLFCVCLRFPNVWQPVGSCQMSKDADLAC